ncbi:hypothetical protein BDV06DRAFT_216941 [Aspergillus oleicola]
MVGNSSPGYKNLFLQTEERLKQEEERRKLAEDDGRRGREAATDRRHSRRTTFLEFLHLCHNLLSRPLKVATPSRSTTRTIPLPKGKHCPTRLRPWTDCVRQQQAIYNRLARRFALRPISSKQGIKTYKQVAMEDYIRDIILELYKILAA